MDSLPPFYQMKTLLGYGPGEPDCNSRRLHFPSEALTHRNVLQISSMGQAWSEEDKTKLNDAARLLNELWEKFNGASSE